MREPHQRGVLRSCSIRATDKMIPVLIEQHMRNAYGRARPAPTRGPGEPRTPLSTAPVSGYGRPHCGRARTENHRMSATPPLIELAGLCRDYGPVRAVGGVDLQLWRGEMLGLLGPNGAGKSSAMRVLAGCLAPSAGRVCIEGVDLLEEPRRAKRHLGYLPEQPPIYPEMTVAEYLTFAAALHGVAPRARADAVRRAVARCGLDGVERRLLGHLSKGYQQRAGIAQAIVHEPAAVVLDEPTAGLDPIQIREVRALIGELGRERGVILSTHILPEVQAVCSRVAIMHAGHIVYENALTAVDTANPGDRLLVALARPPARDALEAISGVARAEPLEDGRLRLVLETEDGAEQVAAELVAAGWGLTELVAERPSLEQIFVDVTTQDRAAAQ